MESGDERTKLIKNFLRIINGIQLSWFDVLDYIWRAGKIVRNGFAVDGIYEVLEYKTTLEEAAVDGEGYTGNPCKPWMEN